MTSQNRRITALVFACLAAGVLQAQTATRGVNPSEIRDLDRLASRYKSRWESIFVSQTERPIAAVDAATSLNNAEGSNTAWLKKYRASAIEVLLGMERFGSDPVYFFAGDLLPMQGLSWAGQTNVALIASISTVYNADRLSTKERAAAVLSDNILPAMHTLADRFIGDMPPLVSIFVVYGVRDTASGDKARAEMVGLISLPTRLAEFTSHQITDDDFVDRSTVLASAAGEDRNFVRIKVAPQ